MTLDRNDALMSLSIFRGCNPDLNVAVKAIEKCKESLYAETVKIASLQS